MFAHLKKFSFNAFWGWMGGRHFVLAAFFSVTAFYLALHGLLTKEYAGAMCAIQGFMTWRTTHEDKKDVAMASAKSDSNSESNAQNTTVINVEPAVGSDGDKG